MNENEGEHNTILSSKEQRIFTMQRKKLMKMQFLDAKVSLWNVISFPTMHYSLDVWYKGNYNSIIGTILSNFYALHYYLKFLKHDKNRGSNTENLLVEVFFNVSYTTYFNSILFL